MHLVIQVSLSAAEHALPSADAIVALTDFMPVQPVALASVALALEQQPAEAAVADASVAVAFVQAVPVLLQVAPVFEAAEHSGPAWATDALKSEVRQQSEPQYWPETNDPAATRNSAAISIIVALLAFFNPMHSSVSGYVM
jgi:hypothetical protein